jgi:hypothetical protein
MSHPTRFGSRSVTALPASAELEVSLELRLASRQPQSRSRARARSSSGSETKGRRALSGSVLIADQRCTTRPKALKVLSRFRSARSQTRSFRVPRSRSTRNECTAGYPCRRTSSTWPRCQLAIGCFRLRAPKARRRSLPASRNDACAARPAPSPACGRGQGRGQPAADDSPARALTPGPSPTRVGEGSSAPLGRLPTKRKQRPASSHLGVKSPSTSLRPL